MYDKCKEFYFKVNTFTNFNSCMHLSAYQNIPLNHLLCINLCSTKFKSHKIKKLM